MQMQIGVYGSGLSYRGVGVNFGKRADLVFRNAPDEGVLALRMEDDFDIAGEGTIMIVTHLVSQWFPVNVSASEWLFDIHELEGRFAQLRLSGGSLGNIDDAKVAIELSIDNRFGQASERLFASGIPVIDGSLNFGEFEIGAQLSVVRANKVIVYDSHGNAHFRTATEGFEK